MNYESIACPNCGAAPGAHCMDGDTPLMMGGNYPNVHAVHAQRMAAAESPAPVRRRVPFDSVQQDSGVVSLSLLSEGIDVEVSRENVMSLLLVTLTALRVAGDRETIEAALMSVRANLGRWA